MISCIYPIRRHRLWVYFVISDLRDFCREVHVEARDLFKLWVFIAFRVREGLASGLVDIRNYIRFNAHDVMAFSSIADRAPGMFVVLDITAVVLLINARCKIL